MTEPAEPDAARRELWFVTGCAALLAAISLWYSYSHGLLLLYGDAVAHLHIARRIFDSATPGFRQLGSVWLPLPHLLLIPFVQKMSWWRTGLAGAPPSMICYVAACVGFYALLRRFLPELPAALGALYFALNPGLLYLSGAAMTEPLFLAEMIWAALLLARFLRREGAAPAAPGQTAAQAAGQAVPASSRWARQASWRLWALGFVLACAVFTRYDGWIYAAAAWALASAAVWRRGDVRAPLTGAWILFTAIVAAAPLLWIGYNARQFHDPLDFLRGPYSAKAIEARTAAPGSAHYPGYHSMPVAALYFLKAAELGAMPRPFANALLLLALAGTAIAMQRWRGRLEVGALLLLWLPLPFYAYSVAYGSVPIFIPVWWPFSWYNTRYGMEMLPAFAAFGAFAVDALMGALPRWRVWVASLIGALIVANAGWLAHAGPLVFAEAAANSRTRIPFERALAGALERLPHGARLLMYTSDHIGAVQQAGIPLRQTINEGDYYHWRSALMDPAGAAPYVVAIEGDAVARAVAAAPAGLRLLETICSPGQPCARIYRSERFRPVQ